MIRVGRTDVSCSADFGVECLVSLDVGLRDRELTETIIGRIRCANGHTV